MPVRNGPENKILRNGDAAKRPLRNGCRFSSEKRCYIKFAHLVLNQTKIEYGIKRKIFKYAMKWVESLVTLQSSITNDL